MSQSVRPGNREKGWNDPPEFLHTENSNSVQTKRTILNQRVSHPFDGKSSTNNESEPKLTEPPKLTAPPVSQIAVEQKQELNKQQDEVELSVESIENILNAKVQYLKENGVGSRICEDILKRVKIFVTNWSKLNQNVQLRMNNLAKALETSELNTANDLHVKLILDFPSEVSQWMVGIKKLIHELIELNKTQQQS